MFALWLGQSRVPSGSLGMHGGRAPLSHALYSLALLCLLGALPMFRSPLENILRYRLLMVHSGNGARKPGTE